MSVRAIALRRAARTAGPVALAAFSGWLVAIPGHAQDARADVPSLDTKVDALFAQFDSTATPGCTVAVSRQGRLVFDRGYGMADLEHDVVITPDTTFEAGSVSKQFTAAAVLMLARDGKLALEDSIRKHFPELPEYAAPVTIRQMLQHTSGLRDWGEIAMLAGWPRTTRAHTHAHVLDMLSRQTALNFAPGTDWSYSNSGYNLAAMLVARVSGQSFADFTRVRLFEPLGMRRTSWRDDHRRIVKDRAVAYDVADGRLVELMPFENVHGNGGLLTTVGDLLRWNEFLQAPTAPNQALVQELQTPGQLANGRSHGYAFGLFVGDYKGVHEVSHGGSTAGYRAYLTRFPKEALSVAVLCNVGTAGAERMAHDVAELYLGTAMKERRVTAIQLNSDDMANLLGDFRSAKSGGVVSIVRDKEGLRVRGGPPLVAVEPGRFVYGSSTASASPSQGLPVTRITVEAGNGTEDTYERVTRVTPTVQALAEYAGTYRTPEVDGDLRVLVEGGTLQITRRPGVSVPLTPLYRDAFEAAFGVLRFVREASGRITHLRVGTPRAWDVRYARVPDGSDASAAR